MQNWQDVAARWRELDTGEAPIYGLLVACAVAPGGGDGKTTVADFAREANASVERVKRNLKAWDLAAAEGLVPPSSDMVPALLGSSVTDEMRTAWPRFYKAAWTRDLPAERHRSAVNADPEVVVAAMSPSQRAAVAAEIVRLDETERNRRRRAPEPTPVNDYAAADTELLLALRRLTAALEHLRAGGLVPDQVASIERRLTKIQDAHDLLRFAIGGDVVDWDAELARLATEV